MQSNGKEKAKPSLFNAPTYKSKQMHLRGKEKAKPSLFVRKATAQEICMVLNRANKAYTNLRFVRKTSCTNEAGAFLEATKRA